jgi:hypothetical protein
MYSKNGSQKDRNEEYGEYILSRAVKSVHRTYFLDVRATKGEDLFVSITESRKRQNADGSQYYDRHKIVLYKEDILRFCEEFGIIEEFLKEQRPHYFEPTPLTVPQPTEEPATTEPSSESDVKFEDL